MREEREKDEKELRASTHIPIGQRQVKQRHGGSADAGVAEDEVDLACMRWMQPTGGAERMSRGDELAERLIALQCKRSCAVRTELLVGMLEEPVPPLVSFSPTIPLRRDSRKHRLLARDVAGEARRFQRLCTPICAAWLRTHQAQRLLERLCAPRRDAHTPSRAVERECRGTTDLPRRGISIPVRCFEAV